MVIKKDTLKKKEVDLIEKRKLVVLEQKKKRGVLVADEMEWTYLERICEFAFGIIGNQRAGLSKSTDR